MTAPTSSPEALSRYLNDRLTLREREDFETLTARDPEIVRDLEATLRMREGLARLRESGELASIMNRRPRWQPGYRTAIAAALVGLAIASAWWISPRLSPTPTLTAMAPATSGVRHSYMLLATRSDASTLTVVLPKAGESVEFRVLPEQRRPDGRYRVTLVRLDAAGAAVAVDAIEQLNADSDGFVVVYAGSQRLSPGRYELAVALDGDPGHPTRFALEWVPADPG